MIEAALRVLGPVEFLADGKPISLNIRPRLILTVLALDAGRAVSSERLTSAIWGDDYPPSTAAESTAVEMSIERTSASRFTTSRIAE